MKREASEGTQRKRETKTNHKLLQKRTWTKGTFPYPNKNNEKGAICFLSFLLWLTFNLLRPRRPRPLPFSSHSLSSRPPSRPQFLGPAHYFFPDTLTSRNIIRNLSRNLADPAPKNPYAPSRVTLTTTTTTTANVQEKLSIEVASLVVPLLVNASPEGRHATFTLRRKY